MLLLGVGIRFGLQVLKWKTHINNITEKVNSTLGFLRRNLHITVHVSAGKKKKKKKKKKHLFSPCLLQARIW